MLGPNLASSRPAWEDEEYSPKPPTLTTWPVLQDSGTPVLEQHEASARSHAKDTPRPEAAAPAGDRLLRASWPPPPMLGSSPARGDGAVTAGGGLKIRSFSTACGGRDEKCRSPGK